MAKDQKPEFGGGGGAGLVIAWFSVGGKKRTQV